MVAKLLVEFTEEQIQAARRWRFEQGLAWRDIGYRLNCHRDTIRARIDPIFAERYRKINRSKSRRSGPTSERVSSSPPLRDSVHRDDKFQAAMRAAIKSGAEHAPIGVVATAGTISPRYRPMTSRHVGNNASPGALCVDSA